MDQVLEFFIQSLDNNQDRLTVDRKALANMVQSLALQFNLAENDDDMLIDPILISPCSTAIVQRWA